MKKNPTFTKKGLSNIQIKFLILVEHSFFNGEKMGLETFENCLKQLKKYNSSQNATEILEAWEYWNFSKRPILRETYKTPIALTELFKKGKEFSFGDPTEKLKRIFEKEFFLGKELKSCNFYFEIYKDQLYIKYQNIIGSRCIAIIKN